MEKALIYYQSGRSTLRALMSAVSYRPNRLDKIKKFKLEVQAGVVGTYC